MSHVRLRINNILSSTLLVTAASRSSARFRHAGALVVNLGQSNTTLLASSRSPSRKMSSTNASQYGTPPTSSNSQKPTEPGTQSSASNAAKDDAPKPPLSVVFTDIVKSTHLWETDAQAMQKAMQIHDSIIRACTSEYQGYEVKQNGDGFMIVFPTTLLAIRFCLEVQNRLLEAPWPKATLRLKHGQVVKEATSSGESGSDDEDKLLFRGLRLRMSAHWGDAVPVWNEVIGRMDYLGPSVNRAARFIGATEGGQIVVSETFLEDLLECTSQEDALKSLQPNQPSKEDPKALSTQTVHIKDQECELTLLGNYEFDGVPEPQKLYSLVPASLHGRLKFWPKHKHISGSKGNLLPA